MILNTALWLVREEIARNSIGDGSTKNEKIKGTTTQSLLEMIIWQEKMETGCFWDLPDFSEA